MPGSAHTNTINFMTVANEEIGSFQKKFFLLEIEVESEREREKTVFRGNSQFVIT